MLNSVLKNKTLNRLALRFAVWLDNLCYRLITKIAIADNGGQHPKHRLMKYHQFFVDHVTPSDHVVDVGCGDGTVAYDTAAKARAVYGIDFNEKSIHKAQARLQRPNLRYVVGDVTAYQFPEKFDKIILSNVLEHIEKRVEFLKKLHSLAPIILLRVPMLERDWLVMYKKEKGLEYRLDLTHFTEFTPPQLQEELRAAGWGVEKHSVQFGEFWGVVKAI